MQDLISLVSLNWISSILLIVGVVLVAIEMFIPGFGVFGITGIISILVGVMLAADTVLHALFLLIGIIVVLLIIMLIAMRSASSGRLSRSPLVLSTSTSASGGYSSVDDATFLLGKHGISTTVLRPSGIAIIDNQRYDVVSDAEFVQENQPIEVISVEGRRIVVRPFHDIDPSSQSKQKG